MYKIGGLVMLTCINWPIHFTPLSNKSLRLQNMLTFIQHHPLIQADTEGNPGETSLEIFRYLGDL